MSPDPPALEVTWLPYVSFCEHNVTSVANMLFCLSYPNCSYLAVGYLDNWLFMYPIVSTM